MKTIGIFLFLLFCSPIVVNAVEVTLATFQIPRLLEDEKTGEFADLFQMIEKETGVKIKLSILPPRRVLSMFKQGEIDAFFPSSQQMLNSINTKAHNTQIIYYKKDYIFKLKNQMTYKEQSTCLVKGYPYNQDFIKQHNLKTFYARSDDQCMKMLQNKRTSLFICELVSGLESLKKIEGENDITVGKVIHSIPIYFSFQQTKKGKELSSKFNNAISRFKQEGLLNKLFSKVQKDTKNILNKEFSPLTP
jgi:polar amino acid transport system substrate-binding protein